MFKKVLPLIFSMLSCFTQAAVISGEHILANDASVDLGGLRWLSFDEEQIAESQADVGQVQIYYDKNELQSLILDPASKFYGWRVATRDEVSDLLTSLFPAGAAQDPANLPGATWFFENFSVPVHRFGDGSERVRGALFSYGNFGECGFPDESAVWITCAAAVSAIYDEEGNLTDANLSTIDYGTGSDANLPTFLVHAVPIPAPILLFSSSIVILFGRRVARYTLR